MPLELPQPAPNPQGERGKERFHSIRTAIMGYHNLVKGHVPSSGVVGVLTTESCRLHQVLGISSSARDLTPLGVKIGRTHE